MEAYRAVLALEPDDEDAREELGYRRQRDGTWKDPRTPRAPRDHDEDALPEFAVRRGAVVDAFRDALVRALERAEASDATRREVLADVLALDPDDADTRHLLGEGRRGDAWVLIEVLRSDERRDELGSGVADAFAEPVSIVDAAANARESALGLPWTAALSTPDGRVLGTVDAGELRRQAVLLAATRRHLVRVLGKDARYGDECTVFVLPPADKDRFIAALPDLSPAYRDFLRGLLGSGIVGTDDLAQWGPSEADRRDMLVRQAVGWLMADAYGITTAHGWVHEGFGLYFSHQLVGTRLHWFAKQAEYGRVEDDEALRKRMAGGKVDWLVEAGKVLASDRAPRLRFLLGKDVNRMTTTELLVSQALAAYLVEGRPDRLPAIWTAVGEGEPSPDVLTRELGCDLATLRATLARWVAERGGDAPAPGGDEEGGAARGGAPR